jgi:hypothetical protein
LPYINILPYSKLRCRQTEKNRLPKACFLRRQKIRNISIFCRPTQHALVKQFLCCTASICRTAI